MPQAFLVRKYTIPGEEPRKEVFKPAPFYYGTLSTRDAAEQIAEESSLTKGDVLNVLHKQQPKRHPSICLPTQFHWGLNC